MDFLAIVEHHILDVTILPGITKHMLMMWISGGLMIVVFSLLARRWPAVPRGARGGLEAAVVYLRDEVILSNTGEAGRPYVPYFLTLFFFVLFTNLLGLVPYMGTATGNVSVTAALALCSLGLVVFVGIRAHGFGHYVKSFIPPGIPMVLVPLMFPIEVLSLFTRTFALTIRLFANMIAGHIVILAFISLIFLFGSVFVAGISVPVAVALMLLEVFVCFLQAYIFTLLSSIFVGLSLNPH